MSVLRGLRHHLSAHDHPMWLTATLGQVPTFAHFGPLTPRGSPWFSVACMPVGHGAWKASEPLSDLDQLLSIAMHDPNVNAKQVVGVCNTQQRLVHPLPHTFLPYEVPAVFFTRRTTWPHGNRDSSSRSTATRTFFSLICGFTACSSSLAGSFGCGNKAPSLGLFFSFRIGS